MKNNIPRIMNEKNINISQLSQLTGIGRTSLSEIVNSKSILEKTKIGTLEAIAKKLNVFLFELFEIEFKVSIKLFESMNDYLDLNNEDNLKKYLNCYYMYYLSIINIEINGSNKNYPLVHSEVLPESYVLGTDFLTEFELKMIKEKNINLFNKIIEFDNLTTSTVEEIEKIGALEQISFLILEKYCKEVENTFDTRIIDLSIMNRSIGAPEMLYSFPRELTLSWSVYEFVDKNYSDFTYIYDTKKEILNKLQNNEKPRILPGWFNS